MDELQHQDGHSGKKASPHLEAMLRRSALAIVAERLWRAGLALVTILLFFLALSWLGLWGAAPVEARIVGVALFGFAALYVVARESVHGWPHRAAALERLDRSADAALRPASSLEDRLATQNADAGVEALWALHRQRLEEALAKTPIEPPHARVPQRDPYALRALALVAAVAAGFAAGDEKRARLAAAFDWRAAANFGTSARVDAWLEPPVYTGRPPIVLAKEGEAPIEAPVNSMLRIRPPDAGASVSGGLVAAQASADSGKEAPKEQAFKLSGTAQLSLSDGRRFDLAAIPDNPPSITLTERPRNNARGSMTLAFRAADDYGVVGAEAVFSKPPGGPRALYEPPRLALALPPGGGGQGEGKATIDLADSPFGGAKLAMRLVARDAADNEGASEAIDMILPQRRFAKPLARALAEQRRILALDPDRRASVRTALEALSLAPEAFDTPSAIHLGLGEARRALDVARSDDDLRGVSEMLWAMALDLEEGDISQAERDLRAAERELRNAIARGDSEEDIAQRAEELRDALDKFLQQLGARLPPPGAPSREAEGSADSVTPDELQSMLDEMNRAMKSGDVAQAQRLLDELQDILENVQSAQGAGQRLARGREMNRVLGELDRLSREEQQLRDETFQGMNPDEDETEPRASRGRRQNGQPRSEESGAERKRQQALRERLERQQDALREGGVEAGEELDDARRAMKEAEEALGKSGEGRGRAVDAQGRAVQALRKGADRLAQQMRGEGDESAEEEGQGPGRRGRRGKGRDPLGRAAGDGNRPDLSGKYDPLGLPPAQRAHRVQEELRRRLGQPERPQEELDYLQRLLRR